MTLDALFPPHSKRGGLTASVATAYAEELMTPTRGIPQAFCWTRFGTESGETIEQILARKEAERRANGGIFLWGIGNSVAPGLRDLLRRQVTPEVLFSPIKSRPRAVDVTPQRVVSWTAGETIAGDTVELASSVQVLSRAAAESDPSPHYALVCYSTRPLVPSDHGSLAFRAVRNLVSGSPVGASQVTAVVAHDPTAQGGHIYPIALRATLIAPYFLRLRAPEPSRQTA